MLRSVVSKLVRVGRATVFMMGLALMLALVFGMASTAFGTNGGNFILGSLNNTATAITKLTGTVGGGPALRVSNPSTATGSTALDLQVATGKAPMKVNSSAKVANLNADNLDGKDSSAFGPASRVPMWVIVNWDGTIARKSPEVVSASKTAVGTYDVTFNRNINQCAFAATAYAFQGTQTSTVNATAGNGPDLTKVRVETYFASSASGVSKSDETFHLIVTC